MKRATANESLRREKLRQIITVHDMAEFCSKTFTTIHFEIIGPDDIASLSDLLIACFTHGSTYEGTRSFHFLQPLGNGVIGAKCTSSDQSFCLKKYMISQPSVINLPPIGQFVAAVYDKTGI